MLALHFAECRPISQSEVLRILARPRMNGRGEWLTAWAAGGEAGAMASDQAGEACMWRAAWQRGRAVVEMQLGDQSSILSHCQTCACFHTGRCEGLSCICKELAARRGDAVPLEVGAHAA